MAGTADELAGGTHKGSALTADPALPATAVDEAVREAEDQGWTPAKIALWAAIALLGGVAWLILAIVRGETLNAIWVVFASVCARTDSAPAIGFGGVLSTFGGGSPSC